MSKSEIVQLLQCFTSGHEQQQQRWKRFEEADSSSPPSCKFASTTGRQLQMSECILAYYASSCCCACHGLHSRMEQHQSCGALPLLLLFMCDMATPRGPGACLICALSFGIV